MTDINFSIRDVNRSDLETVRLLNNAAVPHVNSLSYDEFDRFLQVAAYFRVANNDKDILGFLVGFLPGADYTSENYRWFQSHHEEFIYIDRIIVAPAASGQGIARALYQDLQGDMDGRVWKMACEVNIRPANERSARLHHRLGFVEVGQQETGGGRKLVSLLLKPL